MSELGLDLALKLLEAARASAREQDLAPMTFVAVEQSGLVKAVIREDGASLFGVEITTGKARGALALGTSSGQLGVMFSERPGVLAALASAVQGQLVPIAGAVLLYTSGGQVLGALAAAGDTPEADEATAMIAAKRLGLLTERPTGAARVASDRTGET